MEIQLQNARTILAQWRERAVLIVIRILGSRLFSHEEDRRWTHVRRRRNTWRSCWSHASQRNFTCPATVLISNAAHDPPTTCQANSHYFQNYGCPCSYLHTTPGGNNSSVRAVSHTHRGVLVRNAREVELAPIKRKRTWSWTSIVRHRTAAPRIFYEQPFRTEQDGFLWISHPEWWLVSIQLQFSSYI